MRQAAALREEAESVLSAAQQLQLAAEKLLSSVMMGTHGRRAAGQGEEFWQYRSVMPGDPASSIDWRRSGSGQALFARETEWEIANPVYVFCDRSQSMQYCGDPNLPSKGEIARLVAMTTVLAIVRAGDYAGLIDPDLRAAARATHLTHIAHELVQDSNVPYGHARLAGRHKKTRLVVISDFLMPQAEFEAMTSALTHHDGPLVLLQILDPSEMTFDVRGRVIFEGPSLQSAPLLHETDDALDLATAYQERLMIRARLLEQIAAISGGRFLRHITDTQTQNALRSVFEVLGGLRKRGRRS